jgi:hypothetical protein
MNNMGRHMSFENFSYFYVEDEIDDFIRSRQGTCVTCEFNFGGTCADAHYGENITDYNTIRDCWSIGLEEYTKRWEDYKKKHNMEKIVKDGYELYLQYGKSIALDVESGTWSIVKEKDKDSQK